MAGSNETERLREILRRTRSVAIVGASPNPARPSHSIMRYLRDQGYRVAPVNPHAADQRILGKPVVASLADVPGPVDLVNVFRASRVAGAVVDEAIALSEVLGISTVWMQSGVQDAAAAGRGEAAGLCVVMDRCIMVDHSRLIGRAAGLT